VITLPAGASQWQSHGLIDAGARVAAFLAVKHREFDDQNAEAPIFTPPADGTRIAYPAME
jgi:hypothetical protein